MLIKKKLYASRNRAKVLGLVSDILSWQERVSKSGAHLYSPNMSETHILPLL